MSSERTVRVKTDKSRPISSKDIIQLAEHLNDDERLPELGKELRRICGEGMSGKNALFCLKNASAKNTAGLTNVDVRSCRCNSLAVRISGGLPHAAWRSHSGRRGGVR